MIRTYSYKNNLLANQEKLLQVLQYIVMTCKQFSNI